MEPGKSSSENEKENPLLQEVLPDQNAKEGHEKQLARYAAAKGRQMAVVEHIVQQNSLFAKPPFMKEQKALEDCGSFLMYRHYYVIDKFRLTAGCTCKKHLLCALCAIRRAAKCVAVFTEKIDHVTQGQEYDTVLITLTIKNGSDLAERYNHLQGSVKKLLQKRRASLIKRPKTDTPFKHVLGAIYSYEVTISQDDQFHPHLHMVALVKKGTFEFKEKTIKGKSIQVPPDLWAGLVRDWTEITGDSFIVDVRLVQNKEEQVSALVETFKYALKFSEMAVETQVHCYTILKGRHMIGSLGALFGVKMPDNLNDELLPGEEKYVDLVYQYSGVNFGYQLIMHGQADIEVKNLQRRHSRNRKKVVSVPSEVKFEEPVKEYMAKSRFYGTSEMFKAQASVAADQYEKLGLYVSPEEVDRIKNLPEAQF